MATRKSNSTSPHIANPNAPLEQLALRALRRYGEMAPSTLEGEVMPQFIDYANSIIDDLHAHPYWEKGLQLAYYTHQTDARAIPDALVVIGLLFRFAIDQGSKKTGFYQGEYLNRMNSLLSTAKFGVGAEFELQSVDYADSGAGNIPGVK